MAKVEAGKGRSSIDMTASGLRVTIPTKKNILIILFLGFWLVGWAWGEVTTINELIHSDDETPRLFLLAWIGAWTVGGAFAIYAWLWNINGKEIIDVSSSELAYSREVVGFRRSKEYDISSISDMRVQTQSNSFFNSMNGMEFWGLAGGAIAFDYGRSTHKFGMQLDEAEAKHIVEEIKKRHKNV